MTEKETYVEPEVTAEVKVQPSNKVFTYKTKIRFIDIQRAHETIVSIQPPAITQAGILQFLMDDRIICFPLMPILRWETEQLAEIKQAQVVVGITEK